jgi:hypothetical protein
MTLHLKGNKANLSPMPVRKIFFLLLITLWVAEPFLSLATPRNHLHHICPTCGMEDMCGDICCCVNGKALCGRLSGLYPAGCTPDNAQTLFSPQSAVKFLPASQPALFRVDLKRAVMICSSFLPVAPSDVISPPPRLEYFAS